MAAPKTACKAIFEQLQTYFSGEHQKVLVDAMGFSSVVHLRVGSFSAKDIPAGGLTELDRLSYVVHAIDSQCSIVPVGSYKKTPIGEIQRNEAFRGLRADAASQLSSYMHLRPCQHSLKQRQCARKDDVFVGDFLDNATENECKNEWTLGRDITQSTCTLRNRHWPGFLAFHRSNTPVFGSFYLGSGIKNVDLAFMI